jgi:RNA polymerase sigma-70 factor (ECF subfamily)
MSASDPSSRQDDQLLSAIVKGDEEAFRELYSRHAAWLVLRLTRRCSNPDLVDQVIQDVFLAAWRRADTYQGRGQVGGWLWGIAIRALVGKLRRKNPFLPSILPGRETEISAEERVLLGVEYGNLGQALNRLSPELRAVVQATVLDGLTTREAARFLGIPPGTVKSRMMRARAQLREELA